MYVCIEDGNCYGQMVMAVARVASAWSADGHCSYPRQEQGSIDEQQLVCVCMCVCTCGKGGGEFTTLVFYMQYGGYLLHKSHIVWFNAHL